MLYQRASHLLWKTILSVIVLLFVVSDTYHLACSVCRLAPSFFFIFSFLFFWALLCRAEVEIYVLRVVSFLPP